jgi:hypothetical protein
VSVGERGHSQLSTICPCRKRQRQEQLSSAIPFVLPSYRISYGLLDTLTPVDHCSLLQEGERDGDKLSSTGGVSVLRAWQLLRNWLRMQRYFTELTLEPVMKKDGWA